MLLQNVPVFVYGLCDAKTELELVATWHYDLLYMQ